MRAHHHGFCKPTHVFAYHKKNKTVSWRKYHRISKEIGPYLGENVTVSRRKCYRISEEIGPYAFSKRL